MTVRANQHDRPVNDPHAAESALSAQQLAAAASISVAVLTVLVERGLVEPSNPDRNEFAAVTAVRLRRMVRLRSDLGVSFVGAAIIADLLERIDQLERG